MAPTDANTRHEKTARDGKRQVASRSDSGRRKTPNSSRAFLTASVLSQNGCSKAPADRRARGSAGGVISNQLSHRSGRRGPNDGGADRASYRNDWVRKRGLVCDWNTAKSEWTQSTELPDSRCNTQACKAGGVHRRSSPRRYVRNVYREPGAEERTRTSTSVTSLDP